MQAMHQACFFLVRTPALGLLPLWPLKTLIRYPFYFCSKLLLFVLYLLLKFVGVMFSSLTILFMVFFYLNKFSPVMMYSFFFWYNSAENFLASKSQLAKCSPSSFFFFFSQIEMLNINQDQKNVLLYNEFLTVVVFWCLAQWYDIHSIMGGCSMGSNLSILCLYSL